MFLLGAVTTELAAEFKDLQRAFARHRGVTVVLSCFRKVFKRFRFSLEAPDMSLMVAGDVEALSQCIQALFLGLTSSEHIITLKRALYRDLIWLVASCSTQSVFSLRHHPTSSSRSHWGCICHSVSLHRVAPWNSKIFARFWTRLLELVRFTRDLSFVGSLTNNCLLARNFPSTWTSNASVSSNCTGEKR